MVSTSGQPLPGAAYTPLDERAFRSSALTRGPWHPEHQHAGPPIALVCREIEHAARAHGLSHLARVTANLLRPVPIGEADSGIAQAIAQVTSEKKVLPIVCGTFAVALD